MRITIAAVGRLRAGPERALFDAYCDRIRKWPLDVREVELRRAPRGPARRRSDEALLLGKALPDGAVVVALDMRGRQLGSDGLAARLRAWHEDAVAELGFVLGGADGLDADLLRDAGLVMSLGPYTWPHLLARIMLAEQLYRAQQIIDGHPYHRA